MPRYYCIEDAATYSSQPNSNNGSANGIFLYEPGFFKFQPITVPSGKYISKIDFSFFINGTQSSVILTFSVPKTTWSEMAVTYNNRPAVTGIGTSSTITGIGSTETWKTVDITSVLKPYIQDINTYGLQIVGGSVSFLSVQSGNACYLDVTFSDLPPAAPSPIYPFANTIDRSAITRLEWKQSFVGAEAEVVWNDGTDKTIAVSGSNNYVDVAANTFPAKQISWKVRSRDPNTAWTDYSTPVNFIAADKPATPTITTTALAAGRPTINWTSVGQFRYRLVIKQGTTVIETIETQSKATAYTLKSLLLNSTSYTIELQIAGANGLWSAVASKSITTAFSLPTNPTWTLTASGNKAVIAITSAANSSYHEILKLKNGIYELLQTTALNATVNEYELASGVTETFKIRTFSPTGGYIETTTKTLSIKVSHCHMTDGQGAEVTCYANPKRGSHLDAMLEPVFFAGRERPVIYAPEHSELTFDYAFEFFSDADVAVVEGFVRNKTKVLVRDNRGRLAWVVFSSMSKSDNQRSTQIDFGSAYEVQR